MVETLEEHQFKGVGDKAGFGGGRVNLKLKKIVGAALTKAWGRGSSYGRYPFPPGPDSPLGGREGGE